MADDNYVALNTLDERGGRTDIQPAMANQDSATSVRDVRDTAQRGLVAADAISGRMNATEVQNLIAHTDAVEAELEGAKKTLKGFEKAHGKGEKLVNENQALRARLARYEEVPDEL